MKIVTMCRGGHVRSVGLKYLLRYKYNHDVMACGHEANTPETLNMMFEWADYIVVMMKGMENFVPDKFRSKTFCYNVGEDRFGNPFHPELQKMCEGLVKKHGLFLPKMEEDKK